MQLARDNNGAICSRYSFTDFILDIIFLFNLFPAIKTRISNIPILICMMFWIGMHFLKSFRRISLWLFIMIIWIGLGTILAFLARNLTVLRIYIFELFNLVFPYLAFLILFPNKRKLNIHFCVVSILSILAMLYNCSTNLMASRIKLYYRTSESYAITYTSVAISIILLYVFFNMKKPCIKAAVLGLFLLSCVCIFTSGFLLALISLFIGVLILLIIKSSSNFLKKFTVSVISIIAMLAFYVNYEPILIWFANRINNHYYVEKIYDILATLSGSEGSITVNARSQVYNLSWNSFKQYPLTGCLFYMKNTIVFGGYIGYHSTILDNLALFGMFLGLFPVYILVFPFLRAFKDNRKNKHLVIALLISYLFIITMDNQVPGMGVSFLFIGMNVAYNNVFQDI